MTTSLPCLLCLCLLCLLCVPAAMLGGAACKGGERDARGERASKAAAPRPPAATLPQAPDGLPTADRFPTTTSAAIVLTDLDTRIADRERLIASRPEQAHGHAEIIPLLVTRARFLAQIDDYARALEHAETFVARAPRDSRAYVARARVLAGLHRFDAALADLDRAREHGAGAGEIAEVSTSIALARDQLDSVLAEARKKADTYPSFANLAMLAVVQGQRGEIRAAEESFGAALAAFRDVSPLTLAWLCFQWGFLYEEAGELARARYLYEIAHARLPGYAEATGHLAGLLAKSGKHERARRLLEDLVASADDPEYLGQLAELESQLGNRDRAATLITQATGRYEDLLSRFPEAFADHAARYFLGPGNDPDRAFALARRNVAVRASASAYTLVLEAALRVGATDEACTLAEAASALAYPSRQLLFQMWRALSACGKSELARSVARRLGMDDESSIP